MGRPFIGSSLRFVLRRSWASGLLGKKPEGGEWKVRPARPAVWIRCLRRGGPAGQHRGCRRLLSTLPGGGWAADAVGGIEWAEGRADSSFLTHPKSHGVSAQQSKPLLDSSIPTGFGRRGAIEDSAEGRTYHCPEQDPMKARNSASDSRSHSVAV